MEEYQLTEIDCVENSFQPAICTYNEWEAFLCLAETMIRECDAIANSINEHTLENLIAQANHFLSGLISIKSFVLSAGSSDETSIKI